MKRLLISILLLVTGIGAFSNTALAQGTLYLVVDDGTDAFYTVNVSTAVVTMIGSTGAQRGNAEGLAPSATSDVFLYSVNNSNDLDKVNTDGSGWSNIYDSLQDCDRGLAFNTTTNTLYGSDNSTFCVINQTTGATTPLPNIGNDMEGLAADPVNNVIYGLDNSENLYKFDVSGNSWSLVGPTVNIGSGNDNGLAYDPDTKILYALENNGELYSVNPDTGLATLIGDTGLGSGDYGLAFVPDSDPNASATALFNVTKTFDDGNTANVDVNLTCTSGLPLSQDFTIAGDGPGVTFVVTEVEGSGITCEVTESGGPVGYTTVLNDGAGCTFTDVVNDFYTCEITNDPVDGTFTASKVWELSGGNPNELSLEAYVNVECDAPISNFSPLGGTEYWAGGSWSYGYKVELTGNGSVSVKVDNSNGSVDCRAYETVVADSGVETESTCDGPITVVAGSSRTCTITNTVFFEGIPTLSHYGLALMALLMLGMGMVGFRRFA